MYSLVQVVDLDGNLIAVNDHDAEGLPLQTEELYGKNYRNRLRGFWPSNRRERGLALQSLLQQEM